MENKIDSAVKALCDKITLDDRADDILKYSQSIEHLMNAKNILLNINYHKNKNTLK